MLTQTIRQQLKGMLYWYAFTGTVLLAIKSFSTTLPLTEIFPLYLMIVTLIWPILSASMLFNREFQSAALPYLFGGPQARRRIITQKILPSLILGFIPLAATTFVTLIAFSGKAQDMIITFGFPYMTLMAMATVFSFLPSLLTIFFLSVASSAILWGFIPLSTYLLFSRYEEMRFILATPFTFWLLPIIPIILLASWLWGFSKYAEPDHRRSYRRMLPKGCLVLSLSAVLVFTMIYFMFPFDPWGDYKLTREGHLFFHGFKISRLITHQDSYTMAFDRNSQFLGETDSELILTLPSDKGQINLIAWSKKDGQKRPVCSLPTTPASNMIFQPPKSILFLETIHPKEWTEIDLISGRKTNRPFMPLGEEGDRKNCYPIAALSSGNSHMLLISDSKLRYFDSDYSSPLNLYLCQSDHPPHFLGESLGLPIQLSQSEIVLVMRSRQALEKYRLTEGQFNLVESASLADLPEYNYYRIIRDYRFWPNEQPLYGLFGQGRERVLLTVKLDVLEAGLTLLDESEAGQRWVSTTPHWSALITHDAMAKTYLISRLDRPQAPFKYSYRHDREHAYLKSQAYGFLITERWPPKWHRIQYPKGKTEAIPSLW